MLVKTLRDQVVAGWLLFKRNPDLSQGSGCVAIPGEVYKVYR